MSATVPTSLSLDSLPSSVRSYADKWAEHCCPDAVHVCDGSEEEDQALHRLLIEKGSIAPLPKLENW
jgi:GTP-dependent phosphoenolpyruvate carboxykinase